MSYSINTAKHYGIKAFYYVDYTNKKQNTSTQTTTTMADLLEEGFGKYGCLSPIEEQQVIEYLQKRGFNQSDIDNAFAGLKEHLDAFLMC